MLELLCNQENITIDDPDEILIQTQYNIDYIISLLNYMKLLKKTKIEKDSIDKYIQLIKDKDLLDYFELIKQKKIKESFQILFNYYDKGFSILDIYYFMYEYSKTKLENPFNYKIIELLCEYIHNIYEGYDHKIWLALLTNDINIIYHNI
jgi:DNA polymerase III gamma/tau subunit